MRKSYKIIYWIATIWLALGMASTGIAQLFKMKTGAGGLDMITDLGYPVYLLALLGVCKILGVVAILVPKFPLVKEWAYAGFFFLMVGAIYSHLASRHYDGSYPALLLLILIILSWYFRPAARKLVGSYNEVD